MALTETTIANRALTYIGSSRIVNLDTDATLEAVQARLHYEPVRDSLLRSFAWRFASTRLQLVSSWTTSTTYTTDQYTWSSGLLYKCIVGHVSTTGGAHDEANVVDWLVATERPQFQWSYQYQLPTDCVRVRGLYETDSEYAVEEDLLLTNDDCVDLWYATKVVDPTKFDPLFVEVLVLQLALQLAMSLDKTIYDRLEARLPGLLARARSASLDETNTLGRDGSPRTTWLNAWGV